jgi:transcriptional regulator
MGIGKIRGTQHRSSKLTEDQVREIKSMPLGKKTYSQIAKELGTSRQAISDIRLGKTWAWLE